MSCVAHLRVTQFTALTKGSLNSEHLKLTVYVNKDYNVFVSMLNITHPFILFISVH
jgi:hypothetical protein